MTEISNTDNADFRLMMRKDNPPLYPPKPSEHASLFPPMRYWRGVRWTPPLRVHNCKCGDESLPPGMTNRLCSHGFSRSILHPEFCDDCDRYQDESRHESWFSPRRITAPKSTKFDDYFPPMPAPPSKTVVGLAVPVDSPSQQPSGFLVEMANDHYRGLRGVYKHTKPRRPRKKELAQLIEFQRAFRDIPTSPYCGWICEPCLRELDSE